MKKVLPDGRWQILDDEAFTREVIACEARTRRHIAAFVHEPDDAKDVYGETVETAYRKRWQFVVVGGGFVDWVQRIASHKINEHFRRQRSRRRAADLETSQGHQETPSHEDTLLAQEDAAQLALVLWSLPASQRDVLRMFYGEQRPVASIAADLGIDENAVRNRLARGRQLLRKHLLRDRVYQVLSEEGKQAVAEFLICERAIGGQAVCDAPGEGKST
jgi:RNA polymerase sigma-70 factor, ECF subfamily